MDIHPNSLGKGRDATYPDLTTADAEFSFQVINSGKWEREGEAQERAPRHYTLFSNAMSLLQPWNFLQFLLPSKSSLPSSHYPFLHQLPSCPLRPAVAHVSNGPFHRPGSPSACWPRPAPFSSTSPHLSSAHISSLAAFKAVLLGCSPRPEEKVTICHPASQLHPVQKVSAEQLQTPPGASKQFSPSLKPGTRFSRDDRTHLKKNKNKNKNPHRTNLTIILMYYSVYSSQLVYYSVLLFYSILSSIFTYD